VTDGRPPDRRNVLACLRGDDRGSLAPAVPLIALMFMLLAGLIIDSSRQLTARARAVSYAEEAARAGASAVDPASEPLVIDPVQARLMVDDYCAAAKASEPRLTVCRPGPYQAGSVTVRTTIELQSGLLGIVGIDTLTATGEGEARPLIGVTGEDAQ
jgi:Flp pilus assembly protein TadG